MNPALANADLSLLIKRQFLKSGQEEANMGKGRIEAFSDGVIAIIITIMVLEFKAPHSAEFADLVVLTPKFLSYLLSFIFVGIYWSNHHHLFHLVKHVNGKVLWANLHLLFWLSLTPFATAWIAEAGSSPLPVAAYGAVMFFSGVAYFILTRSLVASAPANHALATALGKDRKGAISVALYALALVLAFFSTTTSYAIFIAVALIWLKPDSRIEDHSISSTKG